MALSPAPLQSLAHAPARHPSIHLEMSQQPWSSQKHGDNLWAESGWSKCRICWTCAAYLVLNYKTTKRKSKVWFNTLQVCSMFHRPLGRWRSHLGGTGVGMRAMPFPSGPKDEFSMPYLSHKCSLGHQIVLCRLRNLRETPQRFQHHRFGSESGAHEPTSNHCCRRCETATQSQMVPLHYFLY